VEGGKTPVAYVFISAGSGARTIIYERNHLPRLTINAEIKTLIRRTGVALLDPEVTYLGGSLKKIAADDFKLIYDCERWRDGIEDIMDTADYFIPSSEFLEADELSFCELAFYEKINKLDQRVAGNLVMTHGAKGAYYISDQSLYHVPVPQVKAVDTVGAGDNFHAAFALALSHGFDIHKMVKFSVAVASLSCREYGGRKGVPSWDQAIKAAGSLKEEIVASTF
jgi:sugar/nucleoside kinase (ribokinase family)